MSAALLAVPVALLVAALGAALALRDGRRRRAARPPEARVHDVLLLGLPEHVGMARLRVGPSSVVVDDPGTHRRFDLTPTGLVLTRQHGDWTRGGVRPRTALGRDGRGHPVEIEGEQEDMLALWEALSSRPLPDDPRPPVEAPLRDAVVGAVFVGLAGLGALVACVVALGAAAVTATVLEPGDDEALCVVEWSDGEVTRRGQVDCAERAGEQVDVLALGPPFEGELWDTDTPPALGVGALVVVALGGAIRRWATWSVRRRARRSALVAVEADLPSPVAAPAPDDDAGTPTGTDHQRVRALAAQVERTRTHHRWTPEEIAELRSARRAVRLLGGLGGAGVRWAAHLVLPVAALLVVAAFAWTPVDNLLATRALSAPAEGVLDEEYEGALPLPLPFWPDHIGVSFTTEDGEEVDAFVTVARAAGLPDTVPVRYDVERPYRVQVVGDPGPQLALLWLGGLWCALLVGSLVTPTLAAVRRRRARARAATAVPHPLLYVLSRDPSPPGDRDRDATAMVYLFHPDGSAAFSLVVVGAELRGLPDSGSAEVRGELAEGATVRCLLGGQEVRCVGELLYLDVHEVLDELEEDLRRAGA